MRAQPTGLLELTMNDRYISLVIAAYGTRVARPARTPIISLRPVTWAIGCAGRSGDPDIKPAPATTDDKPPDHQDHTIYGCSTRSRLAPTERRGQR